MKYLKFNEAGRNAYEAPFELEKDGMLIRGYNRETNQAMLLADGWLKYAGSCPLQWLVLEQGVIIERPPLVPPVLPSRFTKLQIRRCLRKHDQEDELNMLLSGNVNVYNEWSDAQEIDLYDPVVQQGLDSGVIPSGWVRILQSELSGVTDIDTSAED